MVVTQVKSHPSAAQAASRPLMPSPHSDWKVPERYEMRHQIGNGSYGSVCEAFDRVRNEVVAIKRIPNVFYDLVDCKRILREIALLSRMQNENVVKLLDIWIPPSHDSFDELYIVLEIADSDLKKLFRQPVFLSELHVKTLMYNLVLGMKYVHSAGIYHRDLKPANCLVNQDCCVKICDFGLSRTVDHSEPHPLPASTAAPGAPAEAVSVIPHTKAMKKQLTIHVVTRWYRAPEVILLQDNYTEAIDIWSLGCILAELMNMIQGNCPNHQNRGPLCPGATCYPMSPDVKGDNQKGLHAKANRDQLICIFNVIGTPSEQDTSCLEREDAKKYVRCFESKSGIDFGRKYPSSSPQCIDLLQKMLVFNPHKRISVDDALAHPFFKGVKDTARECEAPSRVSLPFNDWENMTENQLRYAFLKEAQAFHPEIKMPLHLEAVGYSKNRR